MEIFLYLHTAAYSIHQGIGFSVYGENVIILMQNLVIILLFWGIDKSIGGIEKLICTVLFATWSYILY